MVWWILLILLLILIAWLLIAPLELIIDSSRERYLLSYRGLVKAVALADHKEVLSLKISLLGWPLRTYPLRYLWEKRDKQKKDIRESPEKRKGKPWRPSRNQIRSLFNAISIKQLKIDLDTGDWTTNAKLFPVFFWMNRIRGEWQVNFEHRNAIGLHLHTRPYRLINAMLNH